MGAYVRTQEHRDAQSKRMKGLLVGDKNPMWKGGISRDEQGYISVSVLPSHPLARKHGKSWRTRQHQLVAYEILNDLGIKWQKHFAVHHRDGRKDRNEPWNLICFFGGHSDHMKVENWIKSGRYTEAEALDEIGEGMYMILGEEPAYVAPVTELVAV